MPSELSALPPELETVIDVHYSRLEVNTIRELLKSQKRKKKDRKRFEKLHRKATAKDSVRALGKLTDIVDGRRVIVSDPPLVQRIDELIQPDEIAELDGFFDRYLSSSPTRWSAWEVSALGV